ncbi:putative ankyrin repeat protein [Phytophthora citrophthora]|uniref:Ankyrin repeat protein n=1 Tax=Phytophthora citrophthora TaxID=4793 RepID=A0AAD9GI94_9STRA|nr:putative ankyrin repeat protein [Phytophthora citrophthora]
MAMLRSSATYLRRWRLLLSAEPALTSLVACLTSREAVCLLVFALDAQYEPLVRFLYAHPHLLSLGDACRRFTSVLHCAAAHGCAEVVQQLLRFRLSHRSLLKVEEQAKNEACELENASDRAKILAWSARNTPYDFPAEVMYEAARQGDQEVEQWLDTCCKYERHRAMEYAASTGRLEVVMWLFEQEEKQEKTQEKDVVVYMVQPLESKLQVLNWVAVFPGKKCFREGFASRTGLLADVYDQRDPLLPWDDAEALGTSLGRRRYRAIDTAAAQGQLAMVKKLHEDGRWPCTSLAMDMAAANGHLEVVKFLNENRREGGTAVGMCSAAGNGHLEVVQWLHENRSSDGCRSLVLDLAATNGHVNVLRWLVPRFPRFSCSPAFLPSVAAHGHIKTLQYLHKEMRMPLDQRTLEAAIGSGHLELVQYIADRIPVEQKHTLSPTAAEKAAASGNVELLAFVVERLGLWSPQVLVAAATTGNVEMAEWIEKRTDNPSEDEEEEKEEIVLVRERRDRAATSNVIDSMLAELSAASIKRRSSYDNLTSVGSARPLNIVDGSTLYRCASLGHFDMIEWLLQKKLASPGFSLSVKEREIVLRSVVGRGTPDEESLEVIALSNEQTGSSTASEPPTAAVTEATNAVVATTNGTDVGSGAANRISGARVVTADKKPGFEPFAWAIPAKTSPYWQTRFVRLAMQYCPESSLKLEWVPLWAAQRGDLFVLKQLYSVKHPQLFTPQTFSAIMRYTKAGDVLQWFQTHSSTLMGDSSIVEWGVKYRQFAYLTYVFLKFQPVRTEERFRQHGVEYALQVASAMGHLDVVTWICGNCEIFLNVPAAELHAKLGRLTIWKDALIAAARCGQINILSWLHEKFTFFRKVSDSTRKTNLVGTMADAAAGYGQLRVLRWLHAKVAPQMETDASTPVETSFVSTDGLLQAMVNRHVDVVQWVCAVDLDLVSQQTPTRRGELATFLREEADGFVPSKLGFLFPPV